MIKVGEDPIIKVGEDPMPHMLRRRPLAR